MKIRLKAALMGPHAKWEALLRQIGLPFEVVESSAIPQDVALYIFHLESDFSQENAKELLEQKKGLLAPRSWNLGWDSGVLGQYDSDPIGLIGSGGGVVKSFDFKGANVFEEVASNSKAAIRRKLQNLIISIFDKQNLLCPLISPYPRNCRTMFSFRVDADEYDKRLFSRFFDTAKEYSSAISIFFCMASYASAPFEIIRCKDRGFDVHSHAYTHYTYKSFAQNLFNIRKADRFLQKIGVKKCGFASPYGRWNTQLQKAVDAEGFLFSSEFSYDYDNRPSYAIVEGRPAKTLQVPVHPVGLGIYRQSSDYDENQVRGYYQELFDQKYREEEPIIFYDHPTTWLGHYPQFLEFLFLMAASKPDIWQCSMTQWAQWWKKREALKADFYQEADSGQVEIVSGVGVSEFAVFFYGHGKRVKTPLENKKIDSAQLLWEEPISLNEQENGRIFKEKNPMRLLKNKAKQWLDWETSTLQEEIIRESPQSVIKSALRVWVDAQKKR